MIRDAIHESRQFENGETSVELFEALMDIAEDRGAINRRRLGRWVKRHAGQIVNGLRFVRVSPAM
jgi:hypothetical protein